MPKTINDMHRMDYTCQKVEYAGITEEFASVDDLPTEGVADCSVFYWIDTAKSAIFYKGKWYPQDAE